MQNLSLNLIASVDVSCGAISVSQGAQSVKQKYTGVARNFEWNGAQN